MKKEILSVITTVIALAGCNPGSGGSNSLAFDVSGQWKLLKKSDTGFEHFAYIVVDSEGRFMGTEGDPGKTILGLDEGSFELDGSGVSGFAPYCNPLLDDEGELIEYQCETVSFSLEIKDDDTLVGRFDDGSENVAVKLSRLSELDEVIVDTDLESTWQSNGISNTFLTIDTNRTFSLSYNKFERMTGTSTEIAENVYDIKGTVIDGGGFPATGLAFIDELGQLNVGIYVDQRNDEVLILGDRYSRLD